MLEKTQNEHSPNLNFLLLAIFKIVQFKVDNFSLQLILPFCLYYYEFIIFITTLIHSCLKIIELL